MRFRQIDSITELVPGTRIKAIRTLRADEDYLKDHFPAFPVMPGVLMLEALFQAACWLVRASEKFEHTVLMLQEVRNAKFADFVLPGQTLEVEVEWLKQDDELISLKAVGRKGESIAVSARLVIQTSTIEKQDGLGPDADHRLRFALQEQLASLQT